MRLFLAALAVGALSSTASALADPTQPPANPPAKEPSTEVSEAVVSPEAKPEDPTICRREKPTGSRISVKVCMKQSQWVAKSTRSRVSSVQHTDGLDDTLAPLPSTN